MVLPTIRKTALTHLAHLFNFNFNLKANENYHNNIHGGSGLFNILQKTGRNAT